VPLSCASGHETVLRTYQIVGSLLTILGTRFTSAKETIVLDIEGLYATYRAPLLAHLRRLVRDAAVAEDLCQDTFMKVLARANDSETVVSVGAWLYRIATNVAYDYLRRARRIQFVALADTVPSQEVGDVETPVVERLDISAALAQLPQRARALLIQAYAGRSTAEIAADLGMQSSAVRVQLHRARARARLAYGEG
jgi:RNA polymerase sigma-70 factor, ECF subfamily